MYHFIVNPASRSGQGIKYWNKIEAYLKEHNITYQAHISTHCSHVAELMRALTDNLNEILDILSSFCKTYIGKDICFNLVPCSDKVKVQKMLDETNEAISLRYRKGTPPISSI